jgi:hypothetical protein
VADAAGVNANADVTRAGLGKLFFDELKRSARGGYLHGTTFDGWHGDAALLRVGCEQAGRDASFSADSQTLACRSLLV